MPNKTSNISPTRSKEKVMNRLLNRLAIANTPKARYKLSPANTNPSQRLQSLLNTTNQYDQSTQQTPRHIQSGHIKAFANCIYVMQLYCNKALLFCNRAARLTSLRIPIRPGNQYKLKRQAKPVQPPRIWNSI